MILHAGAFAITFLSSPVFAAMPEGDAWNVGSVLNAGMRCEQEAIIPAGQVTPIMMAFFKRVSTQDANAVRVGFQQGGLRNAVYRPSTQAWVPTPINATSCKAIQYVLDQYKMATSIGQ
jgi:hypothetical protein